MKKGINTVTFRKVQKRRLMRTRLMAAFSFVVSFLLLTYAIPCFAVSIWDQGLPSQSPATSFQSPLSDVSALTEASSQRAASKLDATVAETTGPGIATDDNAVYAAKKRVEAMSAASEEREMIIGSMLGASQHKPDRTLSIMSASLSLMLSLLFGILGTRSIVNARIMRARVLANTYSRALKA